MDWLKADKAIALAAALKRIEHCLGDTAAD